MASVTSRHVSRVIMLRWLAVGSMAAAVALLCGCLPPTTATFWSPDGSTVAYESDGQLYLYDVATKESRPVDTGDLAAVPLAWSPDGKTIACYAAKQGSEEGGSLCAVDVASGDARVLARAVWPPLDMEDAPESSGSAEDSRALAVLAIAFGQPVAWSPDGKRIAYVEWSDEGASAVVVDVGSGASKRIASSRDLLAFISWSPDGRRLAYGEVSSEETEGGPPPALFLHDVATETSARIAKVPGDGFGAGTRLQWSLDSTQIGFIVTDPLNCSGIGCVVDAKPDAEVKKLVRGITEAAAWSPDLKGIVFVEERQEAPVVLYRGVQPPVRRVLGEIKDESPTTSPAYSIPQFSPDGRFASFVRFMEEDAVEVRVIPVR